MHGFVAFFHKHTRLQARRAFKPVGVSLLAAVLTCSLLAGCSVQPAATTTMIAPTATVGTTPTAFMQPTAIKRSKGDPNAPVKVIEYSDFQCPFCAAFAQDTLADLEKNYLDTGKVYFEFRDFPLAELHGSAVLAAHAANCAGEQQQYFAMHNRLFQGQINHEWGTNLAKDFTTFLGYARELDLDPAALQSCVQSQRFKSLIQSDFRAGIEAGVKSTPSFLVNGEPLIGAQPYSVWQATLDRALAKAAKYAEKS